MCGIAGITGNDRNALRNMLKVLNHRGPDACVEMDLPDHSVALGHVRLSIIDLDERSNQPFVSSCGRYVLTYNGEIYNYLELRSALERKGYPFRTTSDTEVLLYWIIENGPQGIVALDGMFSFAFLDKSKRKLLLARDHIGEKPLYYSVYKSALKSNAFAFASEIKALREIEGIDLSLDEDGLSDYIRFLYTAAPNTLYKGIRELPPGHCVEVDIDEADIQASRYYNIEDYLAREGELSFQEATDIFREKFFGSISMRLRSDVPIGVYLSGGLDSNAILGAVRSLQPDNDLETFTVKYAGSKVSTQVDESELAAQASEFHRVRNQQWIFTENDNFMDAVNRVTHLFSQPFGNGTAIVADHIASLVSKRCKVGMVGDGGDEILAGYPRYKALNLYKNLQHIPGFLKSGIASCLSIVPESGRFSTKIRRLKQFSMGLKQPMAASFMDWSTYCSTDTLVKEIGLNGLTPYYEDKLALFQRHQNDPIKAAALVDLTSFVPYNLMQSADRTSMAHALELRCPFLSTELIHSALNIPSEHKVKKGQTKPLLAGALPQELPDFIKSQPKRPFNPPMQMFMQRNLASLEALLTSGDSQINQIIPEKFVKGQIDQFKSGQRDNSTFLFGLATLEAWLSQ
ncbi:asparagine synthase (glutamine-hydrolyzing) [Cohnella sp. GCM10027633]|uniref:asparagine synthase (glutamine-hydrolyzing) n=1 Tax=unclassified Cohnella TaxID=2636738 RepID=UPI0036334E78